MNNIGKYFVDKKDDNISLKENIVMGKKYRFTLLTERLIRLEYNPNGVFEDRPTGKVMYRKFPKVEYKKDESDMLLQIMTPYFTLDYVKEKNFAGGKFTPSSNLRITLNQTDRIWYYKHPEARNFGGITYSLDNFSGNLKFEKGLYSTDGFAQIDDSNSLVIDEAGNFVERQDKGIDIYVFMYKKDFGLCLQDYYTLTGYPMLLPRYAFGTWWYKNEKYNINNLDLLLNKFIESGTPLSSIVFGNNWHLDKEPFSFDNDINDNYLRQLQNKYNVKFGLPLDPSKKIMVGTNSYQSLTNSISNLKGDYSFLPLNKDNINIYSKLGIQPLVNGGMDSFVIDYNNIKEKNSIALLNHYCYVLGSLSTNKRMVVFSRNHNIAVHRNTVIFTGRTKVNWNTLEVLPRYNSTASNNGISYIAHAIGGYYGGIENFELYIRYLQLGVFSPILMLASDTSKYYKREPWRWNESENTIIKKYLRLRNSLIPYLYTESYIYHKSGSPIIQPLYYKYPKIYDEPLYKNQYFFGSRMLVCPITKKKNTIMNRVVQRMFIPEGIWYELESGKKYVGNKYYMSFYKDEDYPVFCKEGSIIPMSLDNNTNLPVNMEVVIVPGSDGEYQLYEDDGISNNFKNNSYAISEFNFKYKPEHYEFMIKNTNNPGLLPQVRNYKIRFKNTKVPSSVNIVSDNMQVQGNYYVEKNDFIVMINNVSTSKDLKVECISNESMENSTVRLINDDIRGILEDLEIETTLKDKIDAVLFSDLTIKKKRIAIRRLKRAKLEPKFIKMFLNLLEHIKTV